MHRPRSATLTRTSDISASRPSLLTWGGLSSGPRYGGTLDSATLCQGGADEKYGGADGQASIYGHGRIDAADQDQCDHHQRARHNGNQCRGRGTAVGYHRCERRHKDRADEEIVANGQRSDDVVHYARYRRGKYP